MDWMPIERHRLRPPHLTGPQFSGLAGGGSSAHPPGDLAPPGALPTPQTLAQQLRRAVHRGMAWVRLTRPAAAVFPRLNGSWAQWQDASAEGHRAFPTLAPSHPMPETAAPITRAGRAWSLKGIGPGATPYQLLLGDDARLQLRDHDTDLMVSYTGDNVDYVNMETRAVLGGQPHSPGGSRFLEPWPQDWGWPPPAHLTHGPLHVQPLAAPRAQALGFQLAAGRLPQADQHYGAIPSGMVSREADGSFLVGVRQHLTRPAPEGRAAWWVAPLLVRTSAASSEPGAQIVFPAQVRELPDWMTRSGGSGRWAWDAQRRTVTLFPGAFLENEQEKITTASTSWVLWAKPGQDKVLLLSSAGQHPDHFQVYALRGSAPYVEVEFTGPLRHQAGETSTVMVKGQWVPLRELGLPFSTLGSGSELAEQLGVVTDRLREKLPQAA